MGVLGDFLGLGRLFSPREAMDSSPSSSSSEGSELESINQVECVMNHKDELFELPITLRDRCQETHGWDLEYAKRAEYGYRQFIKLKLILSDWDDEKVLPSATVKAVWQLHLQYAKQYKEACERYCDNMIHLDLDNELTQAQRLFTEQNLISNFGYQLDEDVWSEILKPGKDLFMGHKPTSGKDEKEEEQEDAVNVRSATSTSSEWDSEVNTEGLESSSDISGDTEYLETINSIGGYLDLNFASTTYDDENEFQDALEIEGDINTIYNDKRKQGAIVPAVVICETDDSASDDVGMDEDIRDWIDLLYEDEPDDEKKPTLSDGVSTELALKAEESQNEHSKVPFGVCEKRQPTEQHGLESKEDYSYVSTSCREHRQETSSTVPSCKDSKQDKLEYQKQVADLQDQLKLESEDHQNCQQRLNTIQSKYDEEAEARKQLEKQNRGLLKELQQSKRQREELQQKVHDVEVEKDFQKVRKDVEEVQLTTVKYKLHSVQRELEECQTERAECMAHIKEFSGIKEHFGAKLFDAEKNHDEIEARLSDLDCFRRKQEQLLEDFNAKVQRYDQLCNESEQAIRLHDDYQRDQKLLEERLVEERKHSKQLHQRNQELRQNLHTCQQAKADSELLLAETESRLEERKETLEQELEKSYQNAERLELEAERSRECNQTIMRKLQQALENCQSENEGLLAQLDQTAGELQKRCEDIAQLGNNNMDLQKALLKYEQEVGQRKNELQEKSTTISEKEHELQNSQGECDRLSTENKQLSNRLQEANKAFQDIYDKFGNLQEQNGDLELKLDRSNNQCSKLLSKLLRVEAEQEGSHTKHNAIKEDLIGVALDDTKHHEKIQAMLRKECQEQSEKITGLLGRLSMQQNQMDQFKTELNEAASERANLCKIKGNLENELISEREQQKLLTKELHKAKAAHQGTNSKFAALKDAHEVLEGKLRDSKAECSKKESSLAAMEEKLNISRRDFNKARAEREKAISSQKKVENQCAELEKNTQRAETLIQDLQIENQGLKKQLNEVQQIRTEIEEQQFHAAFEISNRDARKFVGTPISAGNSGTKVDPVCLSDSDDEGEEWPKSSIFRPKTTGHSTALSPSQAAIENDDSNRERCSDTKKEESDDSRSLRNGAASCQLNPPTSGSGRSTRQQKLNKSKADHAAQHHLSNEPSSSNLLCTDSDGTQNPNREIQVVVSQDEGDETSRNSAVSSDCRRSTRQQKLNTFKADHAAQQHLRNKSSSSNLPSTGTQNPNHKVQAVVSQDEGDETSHKSTISSGSRCSTRQCKLNNPKPDHAAQQHLRNKASSSNLPCTGTQNPNHKVQAVVSQDEGDETSHKSTISSGSRRSTRQCKLNNPKPDHAAQQHLRNKSSSSNLLCTGTQNPNHNVQAVVSQDEGDETSHKSTVSSHRRSTRQRKLNNSKHTGQQQRLNTKPCSSYVTADEEDCDDVDSSANIAKVSSEDTGKNSKKQASATTPDAKRIQKEKKLARLRKELGEHNKNGLCGIAIGDCSEWKCQKRNCGTENEFTAKKCKACGSEKVKPPRRACKVIERTWGEHLPKKELKRSLNDRAEYFQRQEGDSDPNQKQMKKLGGDILHEAQKIRSGGKQTAFKNQFSLEEVGDGYYKGKLSDKFAKDKLANFCPPGSGFAVATDENVTNVAVAFANTGENTCDTHTDDLVGFLLVLEGTKQVYMAHKSLASRLREKRKDKQKNESNDYFPEVKPFLGDFGENCKMEEWELVDLEAGEGLVIPKGWLHSVKSFENTVGVSLKIVVDNGEKKGGNKP